MSEDRLRTGMTTKDMVIALVGGNPGSLTTCMEILKHAETVDPDEKLGWLGYFLCLDLNRIYEEKIYMIWNDICNRNIIYTLAVIKALYTNIISKETFQTALDNYGKGIVCEDILKLVQEKSPNFGVADI